MSRGTACHLTDATCPDATSRVTSPLLGTTQIRTATVRNRAVSGERTLHVRIRARITGSIGTTVILSVAKNLARMAGEILRFAQDDD